MVNVIVQKDQTEQTEQKSSKKHIGVSVDPDLYWKIKAKLAEKQEPLAIGIIKALKEYLDIEDSNT